MLLVKILFFKAHEVHYFIPYFYPYYYPNTNTIIVIIGSYFVVTVPISFTFFLSQNKHGIPPIHDNQILYCT